VWIDEHYLVSHATARHVHIPVGARLGHFVECFYLTMHWCPIVMTRREKWFCRPFFVMPSVLIACATHFGCLTIFTPRTPVHERTHPTGVDEEFAVTIAAGEDPVDGDTNAAEHVHMHAHAAESALTDASPRRNSHATFSSRSRFRIIYRVEDWSDCHDPQSTVALQTVRVLVMGMFPRAIHAIANVFVPRSSTNEPHRLATDPDAASSGSQNQSAGTRAPLSPTLATAFQHRQ
jgi:hypothetical protein